MGNTHFGLYGSLGQVELTVPYTGEVALIGVVYVPKPLFPLIELFGGGEDGVKRFYREFFTQTEGTEWKGRIWNIREFHATLDLEKMKAFPFIPREYYWKIERVWQNVFNDGRALEEQVRDYEVAVKKFIERLDARIHSLNPAAAGVLITHENAKEAYSKLQTGERKLLGQP